VWVAAVLALLIRTTTTAREWANDDFHWQRSGWFLPLQYRTTALLAPDAPAHQRYAADPPREPTDDLTPIIRAPAWTRALRHLPPARVCTAILPTDMRLLPYSALLLPTFGAESSLLGC